MLRQRDDIVTGLQRNPEPALLIRCKGGNCEVPVLHDKGGIGKGLFVRHALSHRSARNVVQRNRSFEAGLRLGRRSGLSVSCYDATKQSEQDRKQGERMLSIQR